MKLLVFVIFAYFLQIFGSINDSRMAIQTSIEKLIESSKTWKEFKLANNKSYENLQTEAEHLSTFLRNLAAINRHNERYQNGEESFQLGVNYLTDLPLEQYRKLNGYRRSNETKRLRALFLRPLNAQIPDNVDWRKKGYVTRVKNQGRCGSCWSFSTTGSLEGQHMRKTGKLVSLSEQNLVDCSSKYGNHGCDGGLMDNAFEYIKENKGIDTEVSYPYEGVEGKCRFKKKSIGATDVGFTDVPSGNEHALKEAVATVGPISVAIDASQLSFQAYKTGVYYDKNCSSEALDHGVLVVGYGTDKKHGDYWIVKNSWGTGWGMDGYVLMARNRKNHCGIATAASYPLV